MSVLMMKLTNTETKVAEFISVTDIVRIFSTKEKTVEKNGKTDVVPGHTVIHIKGISEPIHVVEHTDYIMQIAEQHSNSLHKAKQ